MERPPSRAKFLLDSDWDKKWVMSPQVDLVSRHVGTRNRVCMALTAAVAGAGNSNSEQSQTPHGYRRGRITVVPVLMADCRTMKSERVPRSQPSPRSKGTIVAPPIARQPARER